MEYFRHIFVIIFILLLIAVTIFLLRKQNLHFKLLKEMYPLYFKGVNSFYNPFSIIYILGFNLGIVLWFSTPIYWVKDSIKKSRNKHIIILNKKLLKNNNLVIYSISLVVIWWFLGIIFITSKYSTSLFAK